MCLVCDEFGGMGCPACETVEERQPDVCYWCGGESRFYNSVSLGKYIEETEYQKMSIWEKIDIEIEDCPECNGRGYIEK